MKSFSLLLALFLAVNIVAAGKGNRLKKKAAAESKAASDKSTGASNSGGATTSGNSVGSRLVPVNSKLHVAAELGDISVSVQGSRRHQRFIRVGAPNERPRDGQIDRSLMQGKVNRILDKDK